MRQEELGAADRLAGLARQALASLGSSREVTATMAAPDHVLVTVEATGDSGRDHYLSAGLEQALHAAITRQPDRSLDRLRVEVQHAHTGQTLLPANGSATSAVDAAVPRARLIAVTAEAARIFAARLRTDPNAELARTYLHEGDVAAGIQGRQLLLRFRQRGVSGMRRRTGTPAGGTYWHGSCCAPDSPRTTS
ncbi:hypothetical protein ACFQ60_03895 [Streptomyces zhihengii]